MLMEISRVYGGSSNMLDMLESSNTSLWVSTASPSFHETMLTFDQESNQGKRPRFKRDYCDNVDDLEYEEFDTNPNQRGKKRRLSPEQVEYLEKSFEIENKLEPERKLELAKELGLQPRQVAIWFQNRRARYKTKQLEKDYCSLKSSYDRLVLDFDALSKERDNLHDQVKVLTKKLKEKDASKHNILMNKVQLEKEIPKLEIEEMDKTGLVVVPNSNMQSVEETNSAKSDIVDSESPHCTDGNHSSLMENPFDQQSDYSPPDESDYLNMSKRLLLPSTLPPPPPPPPPPLPAYNNYLKVEDNGFYDTNGNSCNFSLVEEQPFWSMLY